MTCLNYDDFRELKKIYNAIEQIREHYKDDPLDGHLKDVQQNLIDAVDANFISWFTEDLSSMSMSEPLNNPFQKITYRG